MISDYDYVYDYDFDDGHVEYYWQACVIRVSVMVSMIISSTIISSSRRRSSSSRCCCLTNTNMICYSQP